MPLALYIILLLVNPIVIESILWIWMKCDSSLIISLFALADNACMKCVSQSNIYKSSVSVLTQYVLFHCSGPDTASPRPTPHRAQQPPTQGTYSLASDIHFLS